MAKTKKQVILMRGLGLSSGITIGKAYVIDREGDEEPHYCHLDSKGANAEIKRFKNALDESKEQLKRIKRRLAKEDKGKEHMGIIDAHLMILKDQRLLDDTVKIIRKERVNAEWALRRVLKGIKEFFDKMEDEYLRERSSDIEHIVNRVLVNLTGRKHLSLADIKEPSIVVAHDISPTDTAQMGRSNVLAFLTDIGGRTSHTAIIARSLEIPAVVGLEEITGRVKTGDTVIVDGMTGAVIIHPSESVINVYQKRKERYENYGKALQHYKDLPSETTDGHRVKLMGNLEISEEIASLQEHGAEGIGLYRTEFLYMSRNDVPTEEELFEAYKHVAKRMAPNHVIIRTLDIGGDKLSSLGDFTRETNPALGLRAIRFSLKRPDIFKTQLRAILRASAFGRLKLMFPMISGLEEYRRARAIYEEAREDLLAEKKPFDPEMEVGVMIEIPAAALIADILAKDVDFFSIGTNDLLQYSLAIDRVNEHVAYLYEPFHPAVLRMIKGVADAARAEGITVGVCGEMAGEPNHAFVFLGLGIDHLSMNAFSLLRVKRLIRSVSYAEAHEISNTVLGFATAREVENYVSNKLARYYKDELWG